LPFRVGNHGRLDKLWQTRPSDDGKGTYREMTLNGGVIVENIYLDEGLLEVTFVKADGQGEVCSSAALHRPTTAQTCTPSHCVAADRLIPHPQPPPPTTQHYNAVTTDPATSLRVLKFGLRDAATKEPLHWPAPAALARGGIEKVFERALQLQHSGSAGAEQ